MCHGALMACFFEIEKRKIVIEQDEPVKTNSSDPTHEPGCSYETDAPSSQGIYIVLMSPQLEKIVQLQVYSMQFKSRVASFFLRRNKR